MALVRGVDQNLARSLRENGIDTRHQLVDEFDADSLSEYKRPWGKGTQRVGNMDQILAYNKEDLQATWAVLEWLLPKSI